MLDKTKKQDLRDVIHVSVLQQIMRTTNHSPRNIYHIV